MKSTIRRHSIRTNQEKDSEIHSLKQKVVLMEELLQKSESRFKTLSDVLLNQSNIEKSLRTRLELLQNVIDGTNSLLYVKDTQGRYLFLNHRFETLFNIDRNLLLGKTDYDLVSKEIADKFRANDLKVIQTGQPIECEEEFGHSDGIHVYLSSKFALFDEKGKVYGVCGTSMDITERKGVERRLEETLAIKESIMQSAIDSIISIDHEDKILEFNKAAERTFGYKRSDVIGKNIIELIVPEYVRISYWNGPEGHFADRAESVLGQRIVIPAMRSNGSEFPAEISVSKIEGYDPPLFTGVVRDITEARKSTADREQYLSLLKATLESTAEGIVAVDKNMKVICCNKNFINIFNVPEDIIFSMDAKQLINYIKDYFLKPEEFIVRTKKLYENPELEGFDILALKDGRYFERYSLPQRLENKVIGRVWSYRDVTKQKRYEQQLSEALHKYEDLVNSVDGVVWETTSDFQFTFISKKAEDLLGYPVEKWKEDPGFWSEHIYPPDRESATNFCVEQTHKLLPHDFEYRFIRGDGQIIWVRDIVSVVTDIHGKLLGLRGIFIDNTATKKLQEELKRLIVYEQNARKEAEAALQVREDFLSIAAHELKTPITPLKMQVYVINRHLDEIATQSPKAKALVKLLKSSEQQLDRLEKFVDDILDVSRINRGLLSMSLEECDLSKIVYDVTQRYHTQIAASKSKIHIETIGEVRGRWDKARLEQVVTNLLTNALKFGKERPIEIRIEDHGGRVELSVKDYGIGISEQDQTRIFERFERAVSLRHFGGLGLGLYIVRQIVLAHGGEIRIVSEVGKGSTFIVEIPKHKLI